MATGAAGTRTGVPAVFVLKSSVCTLASASPHSGPQFTTYAVLSSLLKKAQTGWSKPGTKVTTGFGVPRLEGVITATIFATELEPSLKPNTRFPVLPMERKRYGGLNPWSP